MRGKRGVTRLLVAAAVVGWAALSVAVAFGQDGTVVLSGPSSYEPLPPGDVIESVASSEVSFTVPLAGGPFSGSAVLNLRHDVPARGCTFMSEHRWSITGEFSPATLQLVGTSQLDFQQTTGACGSFSLERTFTIEEGGERFVANVDPESGRVSGRLPVEFDFMVDPSLLASLATGADDTLIDQFTAEYAAASGLATASGTVSAPDLEADPNVTVLETDFAVEFSPVGGPATVTGFGVFHNVIEFDDGARCEWESRRDVEGTGVFDPATGTIEGTHRIGGSDQVIACDFEIDFGTTAGSSPFALMVADDRVTGDIASFSLDLPISGFFEPQPLVGSFDLTGGSFLVNDDGSVRVGLMWDVIWPPAPVDDFLVGVEVPFEEGTVVAGIRMDDGEPSTFTDPEVGYGAMALDDGRVIIDVDRPTDFGDMIGPVRVRWWNVDEGGPSAIGDLELPSDATDPALADVGPPSVILPFDLPELWADGSGEAPGGEAGDDELEGTFADGDPLPGQSDDGGGSSAGIFVIVSALIAAGVYFARKYLRMPRTEPQSDHLPLGHFDLSQPLPEAPDELVEVPLSDPVVDDSVGPGEAADALAPLRERAQYVEAASDEQRQALINDIGAVSRSTSQGVHNLHLRGAVGAIGRGDGVAAVKAIDHAIEALERQQDEDDQTGGLDPEDVQRYVEGGKGTSPPPDENDSGLDAVILGGPRRSPAPGRGSAPKETSPPTSAGAPSPPAETDTDIAPVSPFPDPDDRPAPSTDMERFGFGLWRWGYDGRVTDAVDAGDLAFDFGRLDDDEDSEALFARPFFLVESPVDSSTMWLKGDFWSNGLLSLPAPEDAKPQQVGTVFNELWHAYSRFVITAGEDEELQSVVDETQAWLRDHATSRSSPVADEVDDFDTFTEEYLSSLTERLAQVDFRIRQRIARGQITADEGADEWDEALDPANEHGPMRRVVGYETWAKWKEWWQWDTPPEVMVSEAPPRSVTDGISDAFGFGSFEGSSP